MQEELNGILVVDKPSGISSAKLTAKIKRLFRVKKAGHTGTLDPFATGVMLICLGKATKIARFFFSGIKTYEGVIRLGIETDTQDSTGIIIASHNDCSFSRSEIVNAFQKFKGTLRQIPPVFSALKHEGTPLYKLARMGKPVQKPARTVHIYDLDILAICLPEIQFRVTCSAGTYIRALSADIGKELGCGGHLKALRRTQNHGYTIGDAVSLSDLEKIAELKNTDTGGQAMSDYLIPMATALSHMPEYRVNEDLAKKILNGVPICSEDLGEMTRNGCRVDHNSSDAQETVEHYVKVVNISGDLLAVLSHKKNQNNYNFCCVFSR